MSQITEKTESDAPLGQGPSEEGVSSGRIINNVLAYYFLSKLSGSDQKEVLSYLETVSRLRGEPAQLKQFENAYRGTSFRVECASALIKYTNDSPLRFIAGILCVAILGFTWAYHAAQHFVK